MKLRSMLLALVLAGVSAGPAMAAERDTGFDALRTLLEALGLVESTARASVGPRAVVVPAPASSFTLPGPGEGGPPPWWGSCQIDTPRPICHEN